MKVLTVIKKLNEAKVPFYITGSYAVDFYTGTRKPKDIDLVIKRADIPKIESALGRKFKMIICTDGTINTCLKLNEDIDICCFDDYMINNSRKSFEFNDKVYKRCLKVFVDKTEINVIPIEDLIIFKLSLDRNYFGKNDRADVVKLLTLKKVNFLSLYWKAIHEQKLIKISRLIVKAKLSNLKPAQNLYLGDKNKGVYRSSFYNVSLQ